MSAAIIHGDCLDILARIPENRVDAIVTDPPYGLGFMGRGWDRGVPGVAFWAAMFRVLKPGGHLLAFGGTRTSHRMVCAIEDAGFEIRDSVMWVYGSGFPKSHNIGNGWGTALKPAHEPICLARKPLIGTVAANVLAHGTGAINIDGCRVGDFVNTTPPGTDRYNQANFEQGYRPSAYGRDGEASADRRYTANGSTNFAATPGPRGGAPEGRWPANLIHDGSQGVLDLFPDTGKSTGGKGTASGLIDNPGIYGSFSGENKGANAGGLGDTGSAARFFYCAKASRTDRGECNTHPTVKPTALMRYLCRLVTPPGGLVLDPFAGSGSTGKAALAEGFRFLGIEKDEAYVEIARARLAAATESSKLEKRA